MSVWKKVTPWGGDEVTIDENKTKVLFLCVVTEKFRRGSGGVDIVWDCFSKNLLRTSIAQAFGVQPWTLIAQAFRHKVLEPCEANREALWMKRIVMSSEWGDILWCCCSMLSFKNKIVCEHTSCYNLCLLVYALRA